MNKVNENSDNQDAIASDIVEKRIREHTSTGAINPHEKKSFLITPEKVALFEGSIRPYSATISQYAERKVAYGIWWFTIVRTNLSFAANFSGIYRNGFIEFLNHFGFFKRHRSDGSYFLLRCINNVIEEVELINISDFVIEYLLKEGDDIIFEHKGIEFNATLELQNETIKKQCHSIFNKFFLQLLPTFDNEILKDKPFECFKLFTNGIIKITASGQEQMDYKDLENKCVWKNQIIPFDYQYDTDYKSCHYYQFICNVSAADVSPERHKAFLTGTGYLLHGYNAPNKGQAVILYDEIITDLTKPEGGTGKGLFAQGLSKLSNLVTIDGKKFDENNRFSLQRICDSTQIAFFDDVKNKLGFDRFNSLLTDGWNIEKKNKDEFFIKPEDSPGVLISSNSILDCEGSTRKRRQFILEFSDFYSKHIMSGNEEPIKDHHKCIFFSSDWETKEWRKFYSFMISCIIDFMKSGLTNYEPVNVISNRLRQVTTDDFSEWVVTQGFEPNKEYQTKSYYEDFKKAYYDVDDKFSQRKFTGFLKRFAALSGFHFVQSPPSNGVINFTLKKK